MQPAIRLRALVSGVVLAASFVLAGCGADPPRTVSKTSRPSDSPACPAGRAWVVVVRHAEKTSSAPDAELSPEGIARAKRIAAMLSRSDVTRLVATDVKRTQQTLAPLAEQLGRPVEVRPARNVEALVEELRESPDGAIVVVAHHSNGLPRIVRGLGATLPGVAPDAEAIDDGDYSRVLVVSLGCDRSRASLVQLSSD